MATIPVEAPRPNSLEGLGRMAPWRQAALLAAFAATIAVGVAAALWVQAPRFVALGQTFSAADMPGVTDALTRAGIAHEIMHSGGTVLVESSGLSNAEFVLAEAGLGASASLSMEKLYGGEGGFAETQEDKRQRMVLAKELDLAQTISRLKPVAGAKVHLAIPRRSPFQRRSTQPSASVMVELRPGRRLTAAQVESIRQLVAQGVEGMDPDEVVVTDQAGRLLGRAGEEDAARQLDYVRNLEGHLLSKVSRILTPVAGRNGFAAEVTAQIDFTKFETYKVTYDPESPAVRSQSNVEEVNPGGAGGVPGALAHQPPASGGMRVTTAVGAPEGRKGGNAADGGVGQRRRTSVVVNNELDRNATYNNVSHPTLVHLSAAVVLDDRKFIGADGSVERRAWTPEELGRFEEQIKSAIGFSLERQDVVTVTNTKFAPLPTVEPMPAPPLWEQAWLWDTARNVGAGLLALILVFGVLKPFMRSLVNREIAEREAASVEESARITADAAASRAAGLESVPQLGAPNEFERNLQSVRNMINDDPRRAANVMKEWVNG